MYVREDVPPGVEDVLEDQLRVALQGIKLGQVPGKWRDKL